MLICSESTITEKLKLVKQVSTSFYVTHANWEEANPGDPKVVLAPTLTLTQLQSLVHKHFAPSIALIDLAILNEINSLMKQVGEEDNK